MEALAALAFVFFVLFVLVAVFGGFVLAIWALVDASRWSEAQWRSVEQSKSTWILILAGSIFFGLPVIGGLLYWFIPRKSLKAIPVYPAVAPAPYGWAPPQQGWAPPAPNPWPTPQAPAAPVAPPVADEPQEPSPGSDTGKQ